MMFRQAPITRHVANGSEKMSSNFPSLVRHAFDSVAKQFDLVFVAANKKMVRYQNARAILEIKFDAGRSYELGVDIGKRNTEHIGPLFSLSEILRLRGAEDVTFVSNLMVSDESHLAKILERLARITHDNAADFLMGNAFAFAQVKKLRDEESAAFELESRLKQARSMLDAAWSATDYSAVVKSLEPLEPHLSPSERRKLEYSRERLLQS